MGEPTRLKMPAKLAERARALAAAQAYGDDSWVAPPVRDAATVIMVRDLPDGLHVYLQRRVRTMAFAAGMHVFPGGAVEPDDIRLADELVAARAELAALPFAARPAASAGEDTLASRIAAVRETLEETSHDLGDPLNLGYVGHWVTPAVEDRRFDTRFYAAELPAGQDLMALTSEHQAIGWYRPQGAASLPMLPPTAAALAEVARFATVAEVLAVPREPVPIMPRPVAAGEDDIEWILVDAVTGEPL